MAFNVVLGFNKSEKNRVTKSVTTIATVTGVLKQDTSIIDPVIVIEKGLTDVVRANYVSIPVFGRKYFITDITSRNGGMVEISCHVDVLSTYAAEIKANKAIVRRQEKRWNLYLNDGTFKVYQNPMVLTKAFPSGFTTQELVLAVAGG